MNQNRLIAQVGLVFTTLAWGATFVLVKESLVYVHPFSFIFYRFLIATVAILPFVLFSKEKNFFKNFNADELCSGIICGFLLYGGYAFQSYGLEITIPSKSAFITSISVLIVPIILFFYKKGTVNYKLWLSILVVILGLYLLIDPGSLVTQSNEKYGKEAFLPNVGDILTFGCAIFFAIHIIIQSNAVKKKINLIRFFIVQCLSVSAFAGFSSIIIGETTIIWHNTLITSLLINGVIATAFAIFIMVWAQKILTAGETAVTFSLEPVFAALFSIYMGVENFGLLQWIGGATVVLAVIYYSLSSKKL
tara:strand:+ start:195 stop:1112 length:918 start_codon:yes stop_codon:yes gene_type:complete